MRAVRSLTSTAFTLLVLAAVVVVLLAFALPQVAVPGVETAGVEARAQELVREGLAGGQWLLDRVVAVATGAWDGAVAGARS